MRRDIVVTGRSPGAIGAVTQVVTVSPADFSGSVFLVVHSPGSVQSSLPHPVREPRASSKPPTNSTAMAGRSRMQVY